MSWKGVELQVALPRTQDAGQLQEQMNQRGQLSQDQMAQIQMKNAELKRKKVLEAKEEEKVRNEEDESSSDQQHSISNSDSDIEKSYPSEKHPYLGNIIDYSG
ncbi:hypothetical protein [Aquisalibacillus elongatus]|uniref:Uncharacterized protein n=1 Tax=Aquisalibacillus elongatus TaxID=485577 RepID=A0A3N5BGT9_9BACI|nr:hypothetical protein [Aquisalibacillus elongatus]RPF55969.1 hypothetical protein EDC24_0855 [Aquisalibacillus elongatus]